jgi:hypothetical protein
MSVRAYSAVRECSNRSWIFPYYEKVRILLQLLECSLDVRIVFAERRDVCFELLGPDDFEIEESEWVVIVDRIPACIPVEIQPPRQPDRVFLREIDRSGRAGATGCGYQRF